MSDSYRKREKNIFYDRYIFGEDYVLDFLGRVSKYRDKDILLAGCGAGKNLFPLYFYGANITAIDQSEKAIKFIEEKIDDLNLNEDRLELINADLNDIELGNSNFDSVLCYGVLHHLDKPSNVLKKLAEACKEDGYVNFYVCNSHSPQYYERKIWRKLLKIIPLDRLISENLKRQIDFRDKYKNTYWKSFSHSEVEEMCEEAGLKIEDIETVGAIFDQPTLQILPPIIHDLLHKFLNKRRFLILAKAVKR